MDVLIYFWDDRDGPSFCGWWFGPKVGGDQVWAYCPDQSQSPPAQHWRVPYDGPVDPTFTVALGGQASEDQQTYQQQTHFQQQGQYQQQGYQQPQQGGYDADWMRQQEEAERQRQQLEAEERQRQQAEVARAQQEAEQLRLQQEAVMRAEEARKRDELRRRHEIELQQRRLQEEQKRRAEEQLRRQEEERRAQEEAEKRRQEDERRKQEQAAMLAVRKVIQRVRLADQDGFESAREELEQTLERECTKCGANRAKITEEVEQAIQQARERLRVTAEQKAEEERRRKEQEVLISGLLKELSELVGSAETKVEMMKLKAGPILNNGGLPSGMNVKRACADVHAARDDARAGCKACTDFLVRKKVQVEEATTVPEETRSQIVPLQRRIHEAIRELVGRSKAAEAATDKVLKRQRAAKALEKRDIVFKRYDQDNDGLLNRQEIMLYAKGEFGFETPEAVVDKLLEEHSSAGSKGLPKEKLVRVRIALGIAREEANARSRKEEIERKRREVEEQKAALRERLKAATLTVVSSEKSVEEAELSLQNLPEAVQKALSVNPVEVAKDSHTASELQELAVQSEEAVAVAKGRLTAAREELAAMTAEAESKAELKEFLRSDIKSLTGRTDSANTRLGRVVQTTGRLRDLATRKDLVELERVRVEVAGALRRRARRSGQTLEALFAAADTDGDGSIVEADLVKLLSTGVEAIGEGLDHGRLERVFCELAEGGSKSLRVTEFPSLMKVYYKVCKQTVLTEGMNIKETKTIRRLDEGEVFEAEEEPEEEEKAKVMRVRGRAVRDSAIGYVSIAGNQGTRFLEVGGDVFRVVQSVDLTPAFTLGDQPPVRRLKEGELLQAVKWESKEPVSGASRMKARARGDGAVGWVTVTDAEGATFLKPN